MPITTRFTVGFGCPPSGIVIVCEAGKMDNAEIALLGGPETVKVPTAVTELPSAMLVEMAVMAVVPTLTPVTSPSVELVQGAGEPTVHIVATDGLLEYHLTV